MKLLLKRKFIAWRYLGYSKEELALYDHQIATDNLKILSGALVMEWIIVFVEILLIFAFALSGNGVTNSLFATIKLLLLAVGALSLMSGVYLYTRNKSNKVLISRCLTTIFLAMLSLFYIIIGTVIDSQDYAVIACGLFLFIQVMFDSYPVENLCFSAIVFIFFAFMSYHNKPTMIFGYDIIDSLPFFIAGLFLSWIKSRSKWSSLIHANAMVELKTKQLENELMQNKISMMLTQIQPHFLYNSLSAIHTLCDLDPKAAQTAVAEFSDYLRGNINFLGNSALIPFETELGHIKAYLKLEQMRFENQFNVVFDFETTCFLLPSLTVQPLVENAVKYGLVRKENGGILTLATKEYTDRFEIIVSDNGVGFDACEQHKDDRLHIGISNVKSRLMAMCQATLKIESKIGAGTTATIILSKEISQ